MAVIGGDIGRIADNQLITLAGQRAKPVAHNKAGIGQFKASAITFGQRHRLRYTVHTGQTPRRALAGQGQGNRPCTGTEIEQCSRCSGQQREHSLHQQFSVGPRNQGVRRHFQIKVPKALLAKDIGHRLTGLSPRQHRLIAFKRLSLHLTLRPGVQVAARPAQNVSKQQFSV